MIALWIVLAGWGAQAEELSVSSEQMPKWLCHYNSETDERKVVIPAESVKTAVSAVYAAVALGSGAYVLDYGVTCVKYQDPGVGVVR